MKRTSDDTSVCNARSDDANLCGKPNGHDGPHAACTVAEHPVEVWDGDDDD
jgi:hypothetical protein